MMLAKIAADSMLTLSLTIVMRTDNSRRGGWTGVREGHLAVPRSSSKRVN